MQKGVAMSRIRVDLKGAVAKFPHKIRVGIQKAGKKMKNCAGGMAAQQVGYCHPQCHHILLQVL